jgi:hypothetical protein
VLLCGSIFPGEVKMDSELIPTGSVAIPFQSVMRIQIKKFASETAAFIACLHVFKRERAAIFASLHNSSEEMYNFLLRFTAAAAVFLFARQEE